MRSTCVDHDVLFVDNDVNFTFRNGSVDDTAFQRDGIHLSESGTDRLLRNLDLPKQHVGRKQRQRHESTRRSAIRVDENNQQQQRQRNVRRSTVRDVTQELTRDDTPRDDNEWRVVSRRRSGIRTQDYPVASPTL